MEDTDLQTRLETKLAHYKPSAATVELLRSTPILLLVGISGAGKGTVKDELLKSGKYHYIISHTTRAPRANNGVLEQDGREYHFITLEQAEQLVDQGAYVEAKKFGSNVYGSSAMEFQAAQANGQTALADIEVQGVAEYTAIDPNVRVVYLVPPSYEVWQERFLKRYNGAHDPAEIRERMEIAHKELRHALATPHYQFVMNDGLDDTVQTVERISVGNTDEAAEKAARAAAEQLKQDLERALRAA